MARFYFVCLHNFVTSSLFEPVKKRICILETTRKKIQWKNILIKISNSRPHGKTATTVHTRNTFINTCGPFEGSGFSKSKSKHRDISVYNCFLYEIRVNQALRAFFCTLCGTGRRAATARAAELRFKEKHTKLMLAPPLGRGVTIFFRPRRLSEVRFYMRLHSLAWRRDGGETHTL